MIEWKKQCLTLMKVEKIHDGLKTCNMMEVEAGNKLIEFGNTRETRGYI